MNWADSWNSKRDFSPDILHCIDEKNLCYTVQYLTRDKSKPAVNADGKNTWVYACQYASRLAATGDEALSSHGAGLRRAAIAIQEALEVKGPGEPESLEAAAQLFLYAGPVLFQLCKDRHRGDWDGQEDGLWQGPRGFSRVRWGFWKTRWAALASAPDLSEQARIAATASLAAMNWVEQSTYR